METIIDPHETVFTVTPCTQDNKECIERLCAHCKTALCQYTTMPNHQMYWMEPPGGNITVWKSNETFIADPFYCDMFKATVVKEVIFSDAQWTSGVRKEMLQKLNEGIKQKSSKPPSLEADERNFDTTPWEASLGDRRCFIGLYCCRSRDLQSRQWYNKWFIVCHAGLDSETYEQLENHLLECEEKGLTFSDVFDKDKYVTRARILAKRNRRRLLKQAADIMNISIDSRKDAHAIKENKVEIASIDLETEMNMMKKMGSFHVFYNACCCTDDAKGGVVLNRASQLGPIVLSGPNTSTSANAFFRGGTWNNTLYGAFPANTGKTSGECNIKTYPHMFAWEGTEKEHPLLTSSYRPRCAQWRRVEEHLGYNAKNWSEPIELQPVICKLSSPSVFYCSQSGGN